MAGVSFSGPRLSSSAYLLSNLYLKGHLCDLFQTLFLFRSFFNLGTIHSKRIISRSRIRLSRWSRLGCEIYRRSPNSTLWTVMVRKYMVMQMLVIIHFLGLNRASRSCAESHEMTSSIEEFQCHGQPWIQLWLLVFVENTAKLWVSFPSLGLYCGIIGSRRPTIISSTKAATSATCRSVGDLSAVALLHD